MHGHNQIPHSTGLLCVKETENTHKYFRNHQINKTKQFSSEQNKSISIFRCESLIIDYSLAPLRHRLDQVVNCVLWNRCASRKQLILILHTITIDSSVYDLPQVLDRVEIGL